MLVLVNLIPKEEKKKGKKGARTNLLQTGLQVTQSTSHCSGQPLGQLCSMA